MQCSDWPSPEQVGSRLLQKLEDKEWGVPEKKGVTTRQMTLWVAMQAPGSASLLPYSALGQGWHAWPQTFTPGAPARHLEALLWSSLGGLFCQHCSSACSQF